MPSPSLTTAVVGILLLVLPAQAARKCYGIDGTESDGSQQPCDADADVSACCAINKSRPDICLSSGLCYAQDAGYEGMIYSNGCTDPTGKAKECPHLCPDRESIPPPSCRTCQRGAADGASCNPT